jgi:hypothetical protein
VSDNGEELTDEQLLRNARRKAEDRSQVTEFRRIVKALEKELGEDKTRLKLLDRLGDASDPKPLKITKAKDQGRFLPAATYVMLASDWHMGERVRPENVGWRNEYTPEIAQERAHQFWRSNLKMLDAARAAWDIRNVVLWLGGDLMTGYIHEEYEEENFLSPVEESLLVYETIRSGVKGFLAESGIETLLIPTNNGNHGRTGKKIRVSTFAKNSYEWLTYQYLNRVFKDNSQIRFQISSGYHNIVDIHGLRIRFHHGDAVGYAGGIGGLPIPVNRRIGRQAKADVEHVHLDVIGHFHSLQYPKDFVANGSLIGWNDFADRIGYGFEEPLQGSFVVDDRYKMVSNFNPIVVKK